MKFTASTLFRTVTVSTLLLATTAATAQTSISIGVSGSRGGIVYSTTSGYPVYGYPVYGSHHYYYRRDGYVPAMPPAVIYLPPAPVYYQQPQVIYQQVTQYRGGTYYAPENASFSCTYPREYDRVCNSNGSMCVTCN
jgi:hypothetical protein